MSSLVGSSLAEAGAGNAVADLIEVRLTAIRYVARDTNSYEFRRPDGKALPAAEPGAHLDLHLPNGMVRQYSLTRSEPDPTRYVIGVKRDAQSRGGSRYVHDSLKVGMSLKISAPRNNFPLADGAAPTVLIAGGIGITPIWCMVQRLAASGRPWELFYSCRSRAETAFLEPLQALGPVRFHFDDESEGRFLDLAAIVAAAPPDAHLYCCGPAPMLAAFEAATTGWPEAQAHVEYFVAKSEAASEGGYLVELRRSGMTLDVPQGKTILEVLRDAGIDISSSCEQGICGTCETRVLDGIPDHRDAILTDSERALGKTMMICCSGSKSDRLVLDL